MIDMTNPRYGGLLGGIAIIGDIQAATNCTWDEARRQWDEATRIAAEPSNVVYGVDFRRGQSAPEIA